MAAVDAKTGVVYENADQLMAEVVRLADQRAPACAHGLRVRCTKCEKPEPPRRRNTWSDERDAGPAPRNEPALARDDEPPM